MSNNAKAPNNVDPRFGSDFSQSLCGFFGILLKLTRCGPDGNARTTLRYSDQMQPMNIIQKDAFPLPSVFIPTQRLADNGI